MPRGDRTGPAGMGPMSGRAAGFCAGLNRPGFMSGGFGRGFGMGRGFRGFFRPAYYYGYGLEPAWTSPPEPSQELQMLKDQADLLKQNMESINKRISELEAAE